MLVPWSLKSMHVLVLGASGPLSSQARYVSQLQARSCKAAVAHIRAVFHVGQCHANGVSSPVLAGRGSLAGFIPTHVT